MTAHIMLQAHSLAPAAAQADAVKAALAAEQAARAAAGAVLAQAAGWALFGSFYLDGQEFALDAACIREVVGMPGRMTRLPLSPDCLEGIFMLRGSAIPVLNLARIFDPCAPAAGAEQRVAIIEHEEVLVGLVFDSTGEVLRVRPEQRHHLSQPAACGRDSVIAGALALDDGARLVQVLDPAALVRIDNVPQVRAQSAARDAERLRFLRRAQGRKALAFRAGGLAFALAIDAVQEIIRVPELRSSVMLGKLCKGWLDLRGQAVGVVDLGALLQCAVPEADPEHRRIMIVRVQDGLLGLLVDAVDDIRPYFDADVLPIPMLGTRRAAMFRGCLPNTERGDLLFLAHEQIFSEGEVAEICAGHRRLYQHELDGSQCAAARTRRQVYLAFSLDTGWATDIGQVREIVALQDGLTRPPGLPDCVQGMMQLRQQMICVVDLRRLYGMAPGPESEAELAERRVLVLEHEGERYGVVVDRVDSILNLADSQRRPSPKLLRQNGPQDMRQDAGEVLEVPGEGGEEVRTLFDKARFMATLRAALDA
ncbi:chemotaxis protein CheW [Massilia sp. 9096]|uniref:chemotaxis protein CheW n=1 Tax=Massilia sp. 9096 TaxID=1500894 RepID=UPI000690E8FF|nr:chemotaxis protein CheW [Massilia sp. 9096]